MKAKPLGYMAKDQYGNTYHMYNEKHPRKWLLNHFGRKHADRMYIDSSDGKGVHTGWVIAGHWLSVYKVYPL